MTRTGLIRALRGAGIALALTFSGLVVWAAFYPDITVRQNEEQVRALVDKQVEKLKAEDAPQPGKAAQYILIQKATVRITDRLEIAADVEGRRFSSAFSAHIDTAGLPVYRNTAFYFKADSFKVALAYKGSGVAKATTSLVNTFTKNEAIREAAEALAPKLEEGFTSFLEGQVKKKLETFPVYRPKDDAKGWVIKSSLKSVGVEDGHIVATFSLWQLTGVVAMYLLAFGLAILLTVALFLNPELLIPLALFSAIGS